MYKYDGMVSVLGFLLVIIAIIGAAAGAMPYPFENEEEAGRELIEESMTVTETGYGNENSEDDIDVMVQSDMVVSISATLTWDDSEDDPTGLGVVRTNDPDSFSLSITSPSGELSDEGSTSSGGSVSASLSVPEDAEEDAGNWIITVHTLDCGDVYGAGGIRQVAADNGNSWSLQITVDYNEWQDIDPSSGSMLSFLTGNN